MRIQKKQLPIRPFDTIVKTTCPLCGSGCGLKVFIKDGRAVEIYGDEENQLNKGSLCPRGLYSLNLLSHEKRILQPLLREKLSDPFRPATWNEALNYVAEKLKQVREKYSPESVYFHLTPQAGFGNMALGRTFGELFGTPNVEDEFSFRASPAGIVLHHMVGNAANSCAMSSRHEWSSSRAILLVGVDPATTDPVAFGPILDAKDRGAEIIVLDSRNSITMGKAHIPLKCRVGTEKVVLFSMAQVILQENLCNHKFLKQWVVGCEDFRTVCQEYPPAVAERISGTKKEDIVKAARAFAKNFPSMVIGQSRWGSRFTDAGQIYGMLSLATLTGSIGCPGGGLNLFRNFPPLHLESQEKKGLETLKPNLTRAGSGSGIWRAITEDKPYPVRGIIWDTNPLALCPRGKKVREALRKMEIIVHLGQFPNVTYHHSHVVFPIASFLETEGLVSESVGRYLQWANQVVAPRGECKPADDFWGGLFQRFAFSSFPFIAENGKVDIREMSRFFLDRCPFTLGITPDLLDPDKNLPGGIQWPAAPGEIDYPSHRAAVRGNERLFALGSRSLGSDQRFPTPTGKMNLSPAEILKEKGFQNFTRNLIPSGPQGGHHFHLLAGEVMDFLPSAGFWTLPAKPGKLLFVQIHPKRAKELGIQNGEMVAVENGHGKIEAPAWITDLTDEESIFCPLGGDLYDPIFPFESPCNLMDFVREDENCGRRYLEATEVKVRKIS